MDCSEVQSYYLETYVSAWQGQRKIGFKSTKCSGTASTAFGAYRKKLLGAGIAKRKGKVQEQRKIASVKWLVHSTIAQRYGETLLYIPYLADRMVPADMPSFIVQS